MISYTCSRYNTHTHTHTHICLVTITINLCEQKLEPILSFQYPHTHTLDDTLKIDRSLANET